MPDRPGHDGTGDRMVARMTVAVDLSEPATKGDIAFLAFLILLVCVALVAIAMGVDRRG